MHRKFQIWKQQHGHRKESNFLGPFWMKVIVVPLNTPFLIANNVFQSL